jgi:hypothetical protein
MNLIKANGIMTLKKIVARLIVSACIAYLAAYTPALRAQVSILSSALTPYNVTPHSVFDVAIMNHKTDVQVVLNAKVFTSSQEPLLIVTSAPFTLRSGMNSVGQINVPISSVVYASSNTATILKNTHTLPSGKFSYCISITGVDIGDEYCETLESDNSSFLYLVSPPDKDEIETKYPVLFWTHSGDFSLSNPNEYYRMIVTEMSNGQSAEAAINTGVPSLIKNYLSSHQVQYPMDAKELQEGKSYAWQVQKMSSGSIVNKTECWEFKIKAPPPVKENKYAVMKKELDGTVYKAEGNKIFFRFEETTAFKKMHFSIVNEKRETVASGDAGGKEEKKRLKTGYKTYVINLDEYKVPAGAYVLEIATDKRETYKLKFSVE